MSVQENSVHINVSEIPAATRDNLAAATLEFIRNIQRQPGGREALDAKIAARNSRLNRRPNRRAP